MAAYLVPSVFFLLFFWNVFFSGKNARQLGSATPHQLSRFRSGINSLGGLTLALSQAVSSSAKITQELGFSDEKQVEGESQSGVQKGEKLQFLHITDIHLVLEYEEKCLPKCNSSPCREKTPPFKFMASKSQPHTLFRSALPLGEYGCDAPPLLFRSALQKAADLSPQFVIWTGDTAPHPPPPTWLQRLGSPPHPHDEAPVQVRQAPVRANSQSLDGKDKPAAEASGSLLKVKGSEENEDGGASGRTAEVKKVRSLDARRLEGVMESWTHATATVREMLPGVQVFPVLGDHDVGEQAVDFEGGRGGFGAGSNPGSQEGDSLLERLVKLWGNWLPATARESFVKGGYYDAPAGDGLRVAVLNTEHCHVKNLRTLIGWPGAGDAQLAWLRGVLEHARAEREGVLIAGHIPPGLAAGCGGMWSSVYEKLVIEFDDVIAGQVFGHIHGGSFRILQGEAKYLEPETIGMGEEGAGASERSLVRGEGCFVIAGQRVITSVAHVTPALSPREGNDPMFRMYTLDMEVRAITAFHQYLLNLTALRDAQEVGGDQSTKSSQLWTSGRGPQDLLHGSTGASPWHSTCSWAELADRMIANATELERFAMAMGGGSIAGARAWLPEGMSALEMRQVACGMRHVSDAKLLSCAETSEEMMLRDYTGKAMYMLTALFPFSAILGTFGKALATIAPEDLLYLTLAPLD